VNIGKVVIQTWHLEEAAKYFKQSAERGNSDAGFECRIVQRGEKGFPQNLPLVHF
jgi:TPR repeat protein